MEISRSNYEVWLIDYFDGNLDTDQLIILKNFLKDNPGIAEEMKIFELLTAVPEDTKYPDKKALFKNASSLTSDQLNSLCVAYSENDLSESQSAELLEIIAENPSWRKNFEIINSIKLKPGDEKYRGKNSLIKQIHKQVPVVRIILATLSIAASLGIFFFALYNPDKESTFFATTNAITENNSLMNPGGNLIERNISPSQQIENNSYSDTKEDSAPELKNSLSQLIVTDSETTREADSVLKDSVIAPLVVPGISDFSNLTLATPVNTESLLSYPNTSEYTSLSEEQPGLKKYLTTLFRKTALKNQVPETGPLKGYEIAEAGINGINKVLGWDMSFEKMQDKNGALSSFVFRSRLIKFDAPIKKLIAQK
jgi:hypothetical protein